MELTVSYRGEFLYKLIMDGEFPVIFLLLCQLTFRGLVALKDMKRNEWFSSMLML